MRKPGEGAIASTDGKAKSRRASASQRVLGIDHQREIETQQAVLIIVEMLALDRRDELRTDETRHEPLHPL